MDHTPAQPRSRPGWAPPRASRALRTVRTWWSRTIRRMADRRPEPGQLLRGALAGVVVLAVSASWGLATASADASLGPHLAHYEVTLDHEVTVDLGPLGTLVIDSPLPLSLGARIVVREIPREVTAVTDASTLEALGRDLQGYVQFFTGPESTIEVAVHALVLDAARRTALVALVIVLTTWGVRAALGRRRRGELASAVRAHRVPISAGVVAVVLVGTTLTASSPLAARDDEAQAASAVFDGTPLEGARLTGRLAGVIDTYGGYVVDAYRDNEAFYDAAVADLQVAWADRVASDAELAVLRAAGVLRSPEPAPDPTSDEPAGPGGSDGDDAAGGDEQTAPDEQMAPDEHGAEPVVMVVVSDLHCNVGMARVIRSLVELSGATVVLNAGDTTINGTAVESYCVNAFAGALPEGVQMVVSDGNHDSEQTSDQERAAGVVVLSGEVAEVGGLRILGDSDPNATRIGVGTSLVGEETVGDAGRRLAKAACADQDGIDLLLVHNPNVGNAAQDQGCAPAQVSGHLHARIGPTSWGEGVRFISSSTAGATQGQATLGPLNGVAELTVLRFDPDTRSFIDYRLVRLHPDSQVTVGFAVRWPGGVAEPPPGPTGPR